MRQGPCPMLLAATDQIALNLPSTQMSLELEKLLVAYEDVFQTPKGLPPRKLQDHRIPLIDKGKVIKIRPYRYPTIQKVEIERLIQEML